MSYVTVAIATVETRAQVLAPWLLWFLFLWYPCPVLFVLGFWVVVPLFPGLLLPVSAFLRLCVLLSPVSLLCGIARPAFLVIGFPVEPSARFLLSALCSVYGVGGSLFPYKPR